MAIKESRSDAAACWRLRCWHGGWQQQRPLLDVRLSSDRAALYAHTPPRALLRTLLAALLGAGCPLLARTGSSSRRERGRQAQPLLRAGRVC